MEVGMRRRGFQSPMWRDLPSTDLSPVKCTTGLGKISGFQTEVQDEFHWALPRVGGARKPLSSEHSTFICYVLGFSHEISFENRVSQLTKSKNCPIFNF